MRIVVAGKKERGVQCLEAALASKHRVAAVVAPPPGRSGPDPVALLARSRGLPVLEPEDVNAPSTLEAIRQHGPELLVLAGFGQIVKEGFLACAPRGAINLHGGKLPQYRGSSPMNWALLRGEKEFTLSVIRVDTGVDTGDVLLERTFPVGPDDTIAHLHAIANREFPAMLVDTLDGIEAGNVRARRQDEGASAYWPLRFAEDGLVVWELETAQQVHNKVRALTEPYPCAFTLVRGRKVLLLASRLTDRPFHGEPGRVYRRSGSSLLVAAADRALWIDRARFADTGEDAAPHLERYSSFDTLRTRLLRQDG